MIRVADLDPEDFPFTIVVEREATLEIVWAVTLLRPRPGRRIALYVPPLAREGAVNVLTYTGQGVLAASGPYATPPFGAG